MLYPSHMNGPVNGMELIMRLLSASPSQKLFGFIMAFFLLALAMAGPLLPSRLFNLDRLQAVADVVHHAASSQI